MVPHKGGTPVKLLSGWDAMLLYSETSNVHMHTLKVAVIQLDPDRRDFGIDAFHRVIQSRLYTLELFCYQLVDIPLKMHHPMWREQQRRRCQGEPPTDRTGIGQPVVGLSAARAHGVAVQVAGQPRRPERTGGSAARWSPRSIRWGR
jgi:hypothetical protein